MRKRMLSQWDANAIRAWADRCGISVEDAGPMIGVNRATFYRYLKGETAIPLTVELACRWIEHIQK
jgi:predicted DNA-binding transcriptional regulator AlpA